MKKLLEKVLKLMEEHEYNAMSLTEVEYCTTCGSHILSEYGNRINYSKDCEYVKAMQKLKRTIKALKENKERLNHKTITQEEKCWPKYACHIDLFDVNDKLPDSCAFETGEHCHYKDALSKQGLKKENCPFFKPYCKNYAAHECDGNCEDCKIN